MIKLLKKDIKLDNGEIRSYYSDIILDNGIKIFMPTGIDFYVDMKDKLFIMLYTFQAESLYERKFKNKKLCNNLFCYDKNTGQQLWQVQNIDDSCFTGIGVRFKDKLEKGRDYEMAELDGEKIGMVIKKKFQKGRDLFGGTTFNCISYTIDIDTGEATFYKQGK